MLGTRLEDPYFKEGSQNYSEQKIKGIGLLPIKTTFLDKKLTRQIMLNLCGHANQKFMDLKFIMAKLN